MAGIYDLLITSNFLSNGGSGPVPPTPPVGEEEKTVRFLDYDGTIVQEYTKNEFLALDSMPANPTH